MAQTHARPRHKLQSWTVSSASMLHSLTLSSSSSFEGRCIHNLLFSAQGICLRLGAFRSIAWALQIPQSARLVSCSRSATTWFIPCFSIKVSHIQNSILIWKTFFFLYFTFGRWHKRQHRDNHMYAVCKMQLKKKTSQIRQVSSCPNKYAVTPSAVNSGTS